MAFSAYGSTFSTNGTGVNAILGEITAISFGGLSATQIDVTALTDADKKYVIGFVDGGTITVSCFTIAGAPSVPQSGASTPTSYAITFGSAGAGRPIATFSAYIQSTVVEAAVDQAVTTTYTLRLTGTVAFTATTA
jgi:hypothetical protein